jgi:serine/threonine-protein kinase HipA
MSYRITIQIEGEDLTCGTLFQSVRRGVETTTFSYDAGYLLNPKAFSLSPDMPLGPGTFHSRGLQSLRAFEDAMPDRWGRNLLLRSESLCASREDRTERTLFEVDYLAGANDVTRQGALRIWDAEGIAVAEPDNGVPREVDIPALLDASDLATSDLDADVRDLIDAGSSLGGARPKASVRVENGTLCIAKFPKSNEDAITDSEAWEQTMLTLMGRASITVPKSRLLRVKGRSVLLMKRFDRSQSHRIPYISGLSAVQGNDGDTYTYLELAEFIENCGSNPGRDLAELWRRALFSCAVGNTDNHLRNYGFLREEGGWRLSPVFDVNPTRGGGEKYLATALDFGRPEADARIAFEVSDYFRVSKTEAKGYARRLAAVLRRWQVTARQQGISDASIKAMEPGFARGISNLEAAI